MNITEKDRDFLELCRISPDTPNHYGEKGKQAPPVDLGVFIGVRNAILFTLIVAAIVFAVVWVLR